MSTLNLKQCIEGIDNEYLKILVSNNKQLLSKTLKEFNKKIKNTGGVSNVTPKFENIFDAFKICKWNKLKVVLIGRDHFIKPDEATGLCFSTLNKNNIHRSTKNIHKCLIYNKLMTKIPNHGNLEAWAEQGVLMLNSALTTKIGKSKAHDTIWNPYINKIIKDLSDKKEHLIFIIWGEFINEKSSLINIDKHIILKFGHPSPLNRANINLNNKENFLYCDSFKKTNEILNKWGYSQINWDPDYKINMGPPDDIKEKLIFVKNTKKINKIGGCSTKRKHFNANFINTKIEIYPEDEIEEDSEHTPLPGAETKTPVRPLIEVKKESEPDTGHMPLPGAETKTPVRPLIEVKKESEPDTGHRPPPEGKTNNENCIKKISKLYLFTDGSALNNRNPIKCKAGWGYIIIGGASIKIKEFGNVPKYNIGNKVIYPSNQRAELTGILKGLEKIINLRKTNDIYNAPIEIVTDSRYCQGIITEWWYNWQRNNTKGKLNLDIIDKLMNNVIQCKEINNLDVTHVRSHQKEPGIKLTMQWFYWKGNDDVDKLACEGSKID